MADEISQVDAGSIGNILWSTMPQEFLGNISFLFNIAKAIGIIAIVYLLFLIVSSFIKTKQALRIKSIEENVIEINNKLDAILDNKRLSKAKKEN